MTWTQCTGTERIKEPVLLGEREDKWTDSTGREREGGSVFVPFCL